MLGERHALLLQHRLYGLQLLETRELTEIHHEEGRVGRLQGAHKPGHGMLACYRWQIDKLKVHVLIRHHACVGVLVVNGYVATRAPDPVSRACSEDLPALGGPISAICAAPSGRITSAGPPCPPPFLAPSSSSPRSLMRALISPWMCSVPLCLGMARSISGSHSRRSRGSRDFRKAASAVLYSGERLAGTTATAVNMMPHWLAWASTARSNNCRPQLPLKFSSVQVLQGPAPYARDQERSTPSRAKTHESHTRCAVSRPLR